MNPTQTYELAVALEKCHMLRADQSRTQIFDSLPNQVRNIVPRNGSVVDQIIAIINRSTQFSGGLERFVAMVSQREANSIHIRAAFRVLLDCFEMPRDHVSLAELMVLLCEVELPEDVLGQIYQELLHGAPAEMELPSPFPIAGHLWRLSQLRTSGQSRDLVHPLLDFARSISQHLGGIPLATQLRTWEQNHMSALQLRTQDGASGQSDILSEEADRQLIMLASILAFHFPTMEAAGDVVARTQLNPVRIRFHEEAHSNWQNILAEAKRQRHLPQVLNAASEERPGDPWLQLAHAQQNSTTPGPGPTSPVSKGISKGPITRSIPDSETLGGEPADSPTRGGTLRSGGTLRNGGVRGPIRSPVPNPESEPDSAPQPPMGGDARVPSGISGASRGGMAGIHAALPASFLQLGALRSRAVCRLRSPESEDMIATAFLIGPNLLLTADYVLPDKQRARSSTAQFNFQRGLNDSLYAETSEYRLAPERGFYTSTEHHWTVVQVAESPGTEWGWIPLQPITVSAEDPVALIHHPGGGLKQISLFDSKITQVDAARIRYVTSTKPGSGGAPVFDLEWRLVGFHYASGAPGESGTSNRLFGKEGIRVDAIIAGLEAAGVQPPPPPPQA